MPSEGQLEMFQELVKAAVYSAARPFAEHAQAEQDETLRDKLWLAMETRRRHIQDGHEDGNDDDAHPIKKRRDQCPENLDANEQLIWIIEEVRHRDTAYGQAVQLANLMLESKLIKKREAEEAAKRTMASIGHSVAGLPPPLLTAIAQQMAHLGFCGGVDQIHVMLASRAAGRWLDHAFAPATHGLQGAFTEETLAAWIQGLSPQDFTASWAQDEEVSLRACLEGCRGLAPMPGEDDTTQAQRILCRMVGDLALPSILRTCNSSATLPPHCEVGLLHDQPVAWADVLRLLPCFADPTVMASFVAAVRARACLTEEDTLSLVNRGPRLAYSVMAQPVYCRPLHAFLPPRDRRLCRYPALMYAPFPKPSSEDQLAANTEALRSHFAPDRLMNLEVDSEPGLHSIFTAHQLEHAPIYNQIIVRQAIMRFLWEVVEAPFADMLGEVLGPAFSEGRLTWQDLSTHTRLGARVLAGMEADLSSRATDRLAWEPLPDKEDPIIRTHPSFIHFHCARHAIPLRFMFKRPRFYASSQEFVEQLLQPSNLYLINRPPGFKPDWRCASSASQCVINFQFAIHHSP